jgi:hypothetical protein
VDINVVNRVITFTNSETNVVEYVVILPPSFLKQHMRPIFFHPSYWFVVLYDVRGLYFLVRHRISLPNTGFTHRLRQVPQSIFTYRLQHVPFPVLDNVNYNKYIVYQDGASSFRLSCPDINVPLLSHTFRVFIEAVDGNKNQSYRVTMVSTNDEQVAEYDQKICCAFVHVPSSIREQHTNQLHSNIPNPDLPSIISAYC